MKVIIWGMGRLFEAYNNNLNKDEILCFVDKDPSKQGVFWGKQVVLPEAIFEYSFDAIAVFASPKNFEEISYQLVMEMGIDCRKVLYWEYYLGENFHHIGKIATIISKVCLQGNIKELLDIGGVFVHKQIWNLGVEVDLLAAADETTFWGGYRERYRDKLEIKRQYDLAIVKKEYLEMYSLDRLVSFAQNILFILPLERFRDIEQTSDERLIIVNWAGYLFGYIRKNVPGIRVLEVSHKEFMPVAGKCYLPIYVGDAQNIQDKGVRDNTGDNICQWNPQINECTALYWMWKNTNYEVLGLNHYRRFLKSEVNQFMLQEAEIQLWMDDCDILVAKRYYLPYSTIESQLQESVCEEAFAEGMRCISEVMEGMSGVDRAAFQYVFHGHTMYPFNIFIASRKIVNEYCGWLFPILFKMLDKVRIGEEWDAYSKRIIGFIAERLLTVWLVQQKYRIKEMEFLLIEP